MNNFDVFDYLFEYDENEAKHDQQQAQQAQQQGQQEPVPAEVKTVQTPFDQFTGASIKNIEFAPHENGGSIKIYTSLSPIPLVVSWSGDRVTTKYKDVVALT